jgi:hypothetical protein
MHYAAVLKKHLLFQYTVSVMPTVASASALTIKKALELTVIHTILRT